MIEYFPKSLYIVSQSFNDDLHIGFLSIYIIFT